VQLTPKNIPMETSPTVRHVRCPACGGPSLYAPSNASRPFCSERCKNLDFGAWASESYRMPAEAPPDPGEDGGTPVPRDL